MAYETSNGHVADDVTKVLCGSSVGSPSDSLASCWLSCLHSDRRTVHRPMRSPFVQDCWGFNG